jgi:hypothetical protein
MSSSLEPIVIQLILMPLSTHISLSTSIANTTMTTMSSINMSTKSPARSHNVSCVSLPTHPIYPRSSCPLLSPHTITTTLSTISDDINAITLQKICEGLLETMKQLITRWKNALMIKSISWEIKSANIRKPMMTHPKATLKTLNSQILKSLLAPASTNLPSGSRGSTPVISHALQPWMAHVILHTLSQSTPLPSVTVQPNHVPLRVLWFCNRLSLSEEAP